jgi:predicted small lipoprotein YifL
MRVIMETFVIGCSTSAATSIKPASSSNNLHPFRARRVQGYTAPSLIPTLLRAQGAIGYLVMKTAVVLMLICFGLGACGQKGPLFLPQPAKPQPETKSAPAAAPQTIKPQATSPQEPTPQETKPQDASAQ